MDQTFNKSLQITYFIYRLGVFRFLFIFIILSGQVAFWWATLASITHQRYPCYRSGCLFRTASHLGRYRQPFDCIPLELALAAPLPRWRLSLCCHCFRIRLRPLVGHFGFVLCVSWRQIASCCLCTCGESEVAILLSIQQHPPAHDCAAPAMCVGCESESYLLVWHLQPCRRRQHAPFRYYCVGSLLYHLQGLRRDFVKLYCLRFNHCRYLLSFHVVMLQFSLGQLLLVACDALLLLLSVLCLSHCHCCCCRQHHLSMVLNVRSCR